MGTRWKGKGSEAKALVEPMSKIVSELQSYLVQLEAHALLSGCSALFAVKTEKIDLFNCACFGRPVVTAEKDRQWIQLSMEEAFYLCHSLKCLRIIGEDNSPKTDEEQWLYMKTKKETFPIFYKAYSHLRKKN
ncbi:tRNA-splicing endonuclease subunit Sen2-1-like [Melia azedarach]|uniref:tRNA-splicing endonuclease subunit Sen2-1-like n=1 Tax=Melia azedarach TaxID=155640 RepID=A0ACC1YNR1_MELAZ|nr:tRNA-splicing endonuclease subunit Sen2-1-like [Melia azedarach]